MSDCVTGCRVMAHTLSVRRHDENDTIEMLDVYPGGKSMRHPDENRYQRHRCRQYCAMRVRRTP